MTEYFGYNEIKALQNLFAPPEDDTEPEDDLPQAGARKCPGDIGIGTGKKEISEKEETKRYMGPHAPLQNENGDIWDLSEASAKTNLESCDPREVPEYEIKFKQSVTPEDVFLGVSFFYT